MKHSVVKSRWEVGSKIMEKRRLFMQFLTHLISCHAFPKPKKQKNPPRGGVDDESNQHPPWEVRNPLPPIRGFALVALMVEWVGSLGRWWWWVGCCFSLRTRFVVLFFCWFSRIEPPVERDVSVDQIPRWRVWPDCGPSSAAPPRLCWKHNCLFGYILFV